MITKTATNGNAGALYRHLTRTDDGNEQIRVAELRGFASDDLRGALREAFMQKDATRCEKVFFHVSFAVPEQDAQKMTAERWAYCADRYERALGLEGHQRAAVQHFKDGRWHQHVVWNRIDPETMKAAQLSHERRASIRVARELERELDLTRVSSQRPTQRREQRPPLEWEKEQARRTKIDADAVRDSISLCWTLSDQGQTFAGALSARGLILAKGERRPYVVLDEEGNFYALGARVLPGEKSRTIAAKLADVERDLPDLAQARELLRQREQVKRHKRGRTGKAGREGRGEGAPPFDASLIEERHSRSTQEEQHKQRAAEQSAKQEAIERALKAGAEATALPPLTPEQREYRLNAWREFHRTQRHELAQLDDAQRRQVDALKFAHERELQTPTEGALSKVWNRLSGRAGEEARRARLRASQQERERREQEENHRMDRERLRVWFEAERKRLARELKERDRLGRETAERFQRLAGRTANANPGADQGRLVDRGPGFER
jgi:hypothetical protein